MTLDDARASFEDGFRLGPRGNYSHAPTGEPYVTVCAGAIKAEGELSPCMCSSPELAIKLWLQTAREYAPPSDRKTLYWRELPVLDEGYMLRVAPDGSSELDASLRRASTIKVYAVYSRFLVSDKPQIQPAMLSADAA
jgi:hypothetical protein